MNQFSALMELIFGWLPSGLWGPVWAVIGVAFLILMVKILIVLVQIVTKVIAFFI